MRTEDFDIRDIEAQILEEARKFTPEKEAIEIWAELQHYGGHTNLIDFTTDSHIALFFACDRFLNKPGRVILLGEKAENENRVEKNPENPRHRIIAQKSGQNQLTQSPKLPTGKGDKRTDRRNPYQNRSYSLQRICGCTLLEVAR